MTSPEPTPKRHERGRPSLLLAPAMGVMNRLRYTQKFGLITLLFALPLGLATYYMIREANVRIDFGQKEIYGNEYLRPLRHLMQDVGEARILAHGVVAGAVTMRPELVRKHAEIDDDFKEVEKVEAELGAQLDTASRFQAMRENWRFLHQETLTLQAADRDKLYADLLAEVTSLFSHVGDTSNLILDPDLDTYYVMDSTLLKLPEGENLVADLRLYARGLLAKKALSTEERAELTRRLGLIRSNIEKTQAGLEVAFKNNPADNLRSKLAKPLAELGESTIDLVKAMERQVAEAEAVGMEAADFDARSSKALGLSFDFWDRSVTELDWLLVKRIDVFRKNLTFVLIVLVVALVVVFYLFLGFNRGVMTTIGSLEDAAEAMVHGEMGGTLTLQTRDELGLVARSFNAIASRLRAEWSQAQEESAKARAAETRVREGEQRIRLVIDNALDAIVTVDAEGNVAEWNPQAEVIFGWPRDAALGKPLVEIAFPLGLRARQDRSFREFLATGAGDVSNRRIETRGLHRDGHEFPIEIAISPLKIEGRFIFSAFIRDITTRKAAERALEQQTALVRLLQEIAVAANEATTTDQALQVGVEKVCAATSWPVGHAYVRSQTRPDEMVPTTIWYVREEEKYAALRRITEGTVYPRGSGMPGRVLASGKPSWFTEETSDLSLPRARLAKGIGIKAGFAFPVVVGNDVVAVLEFFTTQSMRLGDELSETMSNVGAQLGRVFERKRGEAALLTAEEKFRSIFENAIEGIFQSSPDGRLLSANPALARIFGFDSAVDLAAAMTDVNRGLYLDPERRAEFARLLEEKGRVSGFESQIQRKDGSVVWISESAHAIRDEEGRTLCYEGSVEDVTERKRTEEALRLAMDAAETANRTKSQFLANMSHELRTPLNAIIGYSEMLTEEAQDAGNESFTVDLQRIRSAGKHLLTVINDILDLSKIEAGKMELFLETFEVATVISDVVSTIEPLVQKNRNQLEVTIPPGLGTMKADLTRLRQCLFNLLSNACKFTEAGRVTLAASRRMVNGEECFEFRVSDSGIGMTQEQMERLFQAFSQADASTTKKYGGTGLGLAISRRFCQMMGGDISVASEPGKGSTFTILLPANDRGAKGAEEPVAPPRPLAVPKDSPLVLVIDDDPNVHDMMRRMLAKLGLGAICAATGVEGLLLARQHHPLAITLDVLMPGMDGWAVLAELKADPDLSSIPVYMVSMTDNRGMGLALGVSEYLTKPVDWDRFSHLLADLRPANPPRRLLIVEDDADMRNLIARKVQDAGWTVSEAGNGKVALEVVGKTRPSLILLDLMMPEMDGFEFLEHIRRRPDARGIPVIVLTAKDLSPEERARLRGQVERVFEKGKTSSEEILAEIEACLCRCITTMQAKAARRNPVA